MSCGARLPAGRLPHPHLFYIIGLIIFAIGLVIRWGSIMYLGRFFTVNVAIARDHELITTGPYRFVRHPSYTGTFFIFLGFGLCLLNIWAMIALLLPVWAVFLWRMQVEEIALRGAFGERYRTYAERTWRVLPPLY
ncbi:MAG TPA: isoprenylcysteine carboxylmethyltransferase family protein [Chthoniobacterales bacterium]